MLKQILIPAIFGLIGTAILVNLGLWQLSRAEEKAALIAEMETRIFLPPVPLPDAPDPEQDRYLPVEVSGRFVQDHSFALAAQRAQGPGFHLISVLETDRGRRVMVDRGFLPEAARPGLVVESADVELAGNLHWPRDANAYTPDYDAGRNLFFARDVGQMAALLNAEEMLVVLRRTSEPMPPATPVPVYEVRLPDNHLGYAVQWFLMAIAWLGMTVFFLWRITRQRDQGSGRT
ncbi:SURF1 family protein [Roseinatronobacter sp. NSM]|uniref:SURF1 family protein n=1 Tax=Roseinatronobacter sp. NSM TaxID=3457785 RepID=UPI004036A2C3